MNEIEKLSDNSCARTPFYGFGALLVVLPALFFAGCSTGQVSSTDAAPPQEAVSAVEVSVPAPQALAESVEIAPLADVESGVAVAPPSEPESVTPQPTQDVAPVGVEQPPALVTEEQIVSPVEVEPPNPMGIAVPRRKEVHDVINEFLGPNREAIVRGRVRALRYSDYIRQVLAEKGLPQGLYVLPMVESSFRTDAYSHAGASGMWQFIDSTARLSGLRVDWWVDERLDWRASTRAAVDHLQELYQRFGDWELSLAAYNAGPGGVGRAISKGGADFWQLCDLKLLRSETRRYVPKFYALMDIFSNPEAYGFEPSEVAQTVELDEVKVDSPVDLHTVSRIAGVDEGVLKRLNPALLRGCTPPGAAEYLLYVPRGRGELVSAELAKLGAVERLDFKRHRVAPGDTLWKIAKKYSTRVDAIAELNRLSNPKLIRPGAELVVPVRKGVGYGAGAASVEFGERLVHIVRKGDSLWSISRSYGAAVSDLLAWNRMGNSSKIFVGNKLLVSPASATSLALAERPVYVVERGDSLWSISRTRGVTVDELRRWNRLGGDDILRPGDKLRVAPVAD